MTTPTDLRELCQRPRRLRRPPGPRRTPRARAAGRLPGPLAARRARPARHHRAGRARPLLAADHVRRRRRAGRARAGRQAAQPGGRPRQRGHADRPGPQRAGPRARASTAPPSPTASPPTRTTPPRTSPRPSPCSATSSTPTSRREPCEHHPRSTHDAAPRPRRGTSPRADRLGFFDQPRAVWAVAFACVISFMGIGLVDPILKSIADQLDATPSQVSLLFTSYMAVMGVAMLVTGVVSSRIGAKRTLLAGLALIIVFSAPGRALGLHRRDRRLPGRLGPGQRAVHRHRALDDRDRRARLGRRRRSSCSRPRSASASPPARCSAARSARSRGARRSSAWPVLMTFALVATTFLLPAHPAGRAPYVAGRPVPRAALPRAADDRADRAVLQHGLLHAARLHAVPAGHDRPPGRPDLLRLGPAARDHLGVGGAGAAAPRSGRSRPCWSR